MFIFKVLMAIVFFCTIAHNNKAYANESFFNEKINKDSIKFTIKAKLFPRHLKYAKIYSDLNNEDVEFENKEYFNTIDQSLKKFTDKLKRLSNGILQADYVLKFDHTEISENSYRGIDRNKTYQTCSVSNGLGVQHRGCLNDNNGKWNYGGNWSECAATYCNEGFELVNGVCQKTTCLGSSYQVCEYKNDEGTKVGGGTMSRTCSNNKWSEWGECQLVSCDVQYEKVNGSCRETQCKSTLNTISDYSSFDKEFTDINDPAAKTIRFGALYLKDAGNVDQYMVRTYHMNQYAISLARPWGRFLPSHIYDPKGQSYGHEFLHNLDFAFDFSGEPGMIFLHNSNEPNYSSCHPPTKGERAEIYELNTENVLTYKVDESREGDKCTGELIDYCKLNGAVGFFDLGDLCNKREIVSPITLSPEIVSNVRIKMKNACSSTEAILSWDTVPYATYYRIARGSKFIKNKLFSFDYTQKRVKYIDKKIRPNDQKRDYSIFACNKNGCSETSASLPTCSL